MLVGVTKFEVKICQILMSLFLQGIGNENANDHQTAVSEHVIFRYISDASSYFVCKNKLLNVRNRLLEISKLIS